MVAFITDGKLTAQDLDLEKTYDITGAADIGDNPYVDYDKTTGNYTYYFLVKAKAGFVKVESYQLDRDFNFISNSDEELSVEQARTKFPWWNYKGDKYTSTAIYVDEKDDLILKKKTIELTYNWGKLQYTQKVSINEKLKLRSEDGSKYFHFRNWWSEDNGDFTYVLCGIKSPTDKLDYCKNFHILKINKDLDIVKDVSIKFDFPQEVIFPTFLDEKTEIRENEYDKYFICMFAPRNEGAKVSDPSKTNFTYVKLNTNLEIIDRISFNSPSSFWSIEDYLVDPKTEAVYLFGASLKTKDKYFDELKSTKKFDGFEVMKVENSKVAYLTEVGIDEIGKKAVMPPAQKKADPYDGKKFFITNYSLTSDGNLIVVGQGYFRAYDMVKDVIKVKYSDCFGISFDSQGKLTGHQIYDMKGQDFSMLQFLFQGKNPNNVYWMLVQPTYWDFNTLLGGGVYNSRPVKPALTGDIGRGIGKIKCDLTASFIGKVDLANNKLSDFTNYQVNKETKKFYYLSNKTPFIITDDYKLVLLGTQSMSKGKRLWFARLRLD
jgi:hypothetical protein